MDPVSEALSEVLKRTSAERGGRVADYIPELAGADPEDYGIAVVSVLGRSYGAGDSDKAFTIQSVSKPFVYALALAELGLDEVARHVGFEPSGEPFNAISLEPETGRPANPLVNAGAIVASALVPGDGLEERAERIRRCLSAFAGRELAVDEEVYRSESETGDRNRALAHLARSAGVLPRAVDDAVETYFRQCSLLVSATDLATMAATLASGGVNPQTGERVVGEEVATTVMSVMTTCGMYDNSGEWAVRVGLPAKSGVGGGIAAVQPAQLGIGIYSPRLDEHGNSSRGIAALRALSEEFRLHLLAHPQEPRSPIVRTAQGAEGERTVELRGELDFIAAEQVVHHLGSLADSGVGAVHLDLTAVTRIRPGAERLLATTVRDLAKDRVECVIADPSRVVRGEKAADGFSLSAVLSSPSR